MTIGTIVGTGLLSALFTSLILLMSCTPDLTERVRAYEATYNAHNIEKLMTFYTDDIIFEITGVWVKRGKQAMRELAEWDKVTNLRMVISDIAVSGDTATCKLVEINDWWDLAGIGEVRYEPCVMIFRNGMMSEMRAEMARSSVDAYMEVWPLIHKWASEHRSEELAGLLPNGKFIYGEQPARKWLELLRDWRASRTE